MPSLALSSSVTLLVLFSFCAFCTLTNASPCNAQEIYLQQTDAQVVIQGDNFNATPTDIQCEKISNAVVWYKIISPKKINVEISTCNEETDFDAILILATGDTCSSLSCILETETCSSASNASTLAFSAIPGQSYYLGIGGYQESKGRFTLSIQKLDTQDCGSAQVIEGPYFPPLQIFANNSNALQGYYNSNCNLYDSQRPVWYTITPTSNIPITVSTCNTSTTMDTVISVFTGTCTTLQCVVTSDDNCNIYRYASTVTFNPTAGTSYLLAVSGYSGAIGSFALSISQTPPSTCSSAYPISPGAAITESTISQPIVSSDPCGVFSGHSGFWFVLNDLSTSTTVTVATCSSYTNFDTILAVYSGSCSSLSCVASNDDTLCPITGSSTPSKLTFNPSPATTYYAVVSGYGSAQGTFVLTLSQP